MGQGGKIRPEPRCPRHDGDRFGDRSRDRRGGLHPQARRVRRAARPAAEIPVGWRATGSEKQKAKGTAPGDGPGGFNNGWKGRAAPLPAQTRRRLLRASVLSDPLVVSLLIHVESISECLQRRSSEVTATEYRRSRWALAPSARAEACLSTSVKPFSQCSAA